MKLKVKIVLVETSHPGNIGATARAMKNMGLNDLVLVKPECFLMKLQQREHQAQMIF